MMGDIKFTTAGDMVRRDTIRVTATVEFVLLTGLGHASESELVEAVRDCLEDVVTGVAVEGTAGVAQIRFDVI